jgi:hypothetical protein
MCVCVCDVSRSLRAACAKRCARFVILGDTYGPSRDPCLPVHVAVGLNQSTIDILAKRSCANISSYVHVSICVTQWRYVSKWHWRRKLRWLGILLHACCCCDCFKPVLGLPVLQLCMHCRPVFFYVYTLIELHNKAHKERLSSIQMVDFCSTVKNSVNY